MVRAVGVKGAGAMRRWVRRLHLWLGLGLGLLFAVIGLTGSALVFYTGIDAVLHPEVRAGQGGAAPGWDSPVWDRALATGRAGRNDPTGRWTFEATGEGGAIPARYYARPNHHGDRAMLWFSSDGRRILRVVPWGGYAMSWIYELHMQLLAGETGQQIVGWSGVAMLVLLISGLAAWWPKGTWRKALAFKRNAAPLRRVRDWHKLTGLGSGMLLLVLVATGVLLSLPVVAQALFAPAPLPAPTSEPGPPVRIAQALEAAQRALPDGRLVFVDVPNAPDGAIRVRMQVPGDPQTRFTGSYVWVDRHSGRVLAVRDLRRSGAGAWWMAWVRPLHDGTVGGLSTRILAVLVGLAPAVLFATGLLHWLRRRRASRAS